MLLLREIDKENLRKNTAKNLRKGELKYQAENKRAIVKLFNPYGAGTWWLHIYDTEDNDDLVWGWAMINYDKPEYGLIDLRELGSLRMFGAQQIERDRYFKPCDIGEV